MLKSSLTVSDVAAESGVAASAVRFYERQGLIHAARTGGNQRRFERDAVCRVKVARVAQRVGLSVAEIREMLDTLPVEPGLDDWLRLRVQLADEAHRRIASLEAVLDDIASEQKLCDL
ncbi:MerR family transcriptional regulator [Dactylosporangium sp. AC04546]|uniref:MerR family transcriptional regulator n=1 Tax=Dactylosporangium sp. AC04546 TaxID=2862460 RepID=UPI001EDEB991|nr:MerR family transcriptional regulator [Dactylosporangium sp. AC04546]WVK79992.1 MerR family transcriptional regulator [Dactylosporangium sp. AC04546]